MSDRQRGVHRGGRGGTPTQFTPSPEDVMKNVKSAEEEAEEAAGEQPRRTMSDESLQGLAAMNAAMESAAKRREDQALPSKADSEEDKQLDLPLIRTRYANTIIDNPQVRATVEKRCGLLDFDSLVMNGTLQQRVAIRPEKLEVVFQTMTGDDDLFVKGLLSDMEGSDAFVLDTYTIMQLAVGIVEINGQGLPPFKDSKGERDPKMFQKRVAAVRKMPTPILETLSCNYRWFDERVRRAVVFEDLGNG